MYTISRTNAFKKSLRLCLKRGLDIEELKEALKILSATGKLPTEYKPHQLKGRSKGLWKCHINLDWLLVWDQNDKNLTLLLIDTGTHSDIFG